MILRRFVPDSLFGRIAIVLVLNLLLIQAITFLLISLEARRFPFEGPDLGDRIVAGIQTLNSAVPAERERFARAISAPGFSVRVIPPEAVPPGQTDDPDEDGLVPQIRDRLRDQTPLGDATPSVWSAQAPPPPDAAGDQPQRPMHMVAALKGGGWATFRIRHGPPPFHWYPLLSLVASVCLVVSVLSLLFARGFSRRLAAFAGAADTFGRTGEELLLPEVGPREIRQATGAFNRMQERLRRFVHDRTQMLAAISHDLRTPLTRLRLRAEFVEDDEQREKMLQDIAEMEAMIRETLAFARDDAAREQHQTEDLDELIDTLCMVMRESGQDASFESGGPAPLECSPMAMRRALANLLDNAVKYGKRVMVRLVKRPGQIEIDLDDDGPGIPPELREQVFQPFFRLEASRSRDTGGVGLGLSVARTIIRGHGGDITLANRAEGGLRVTVTLPT